MKKLILGALILCAATFTQASALTLVSTDPITGNGQIILIDTTDSTFNVTVNVTYTSPLGVTTVVFTGLASNPGGGTYKVMIPRAAFPAVAINELGNVTVAALDFGLGYLDPAYTLGGPVTYASTLTPTQITPRKVILQE